MALSAGDRLGPYEILARLGAGGMGEVYRARDGKLNRDVAIKVLPAALANDAQYMARFEREAQMLAALNHPNIATVYGVEQGALVMELVEGADLKGPLPLDEAITIARQIAAGLEAAHERGIIHRDLKPANIKLTPAGVVKILDFGLAKSAGESAAAASGSHPTISPTLSLEMTRAGMILGTAAYMSPEQARGKPVDKRADIWAFGVVLYELIAGKRLFEGEDLTETMAAVVKERPDLSGVPASVRRLLERCLEKDPKKRLRDIGDMDLLLADAGSTAATAPSRSRLGRAGWVAAAVLLVALAAVSFLHFRETPPARELVRFEIPPPANATFFGTNSHPVVSPDGRKVAFLASAGGRTIVWIRSLDSEEARSLTGTEGATSPFWSPDSRFVAFQSGGKLRKIEAAGGPAQTLCDAATISGGFWTPDNRILFGSLGPMQLVSAAGGAPTPLTSLDRSRNELVHGAPAMLPDGHHFLYERFSIPMENSGVYVGSLDARPDGQSARRLLPDFTPVIYYVPSPLTGDTPGFLLFERGLTMASDTTTLMAQPFDARRMELAGDAVPLAEQVSFFSASPKGVLALNAGGPGDKQLTWYDRKGAVLSTVGEAGDYTNLALSPDGTRAAFERGADLWLFEFARGGVSTKFTFGNPTDSPSWSADGSRIVFVAIHGSGGFGIYQKASNLAGQEELLYQSPELKDRPSWTHDGRFVIYTALAPDTKADLWILPTAGSAADRKPLPFLRTEFDEATGRFSPDGRWVAYQSNQSGKYEIYVLPFDPANPGSPAAGGLHQVSKDGGTNPHWSRNGKELVYLAPEGNLMSVDVGVAGSAFQTGTAQRLFKLAGSSWDVSADGQRFLVAAPASSGAAPASVPFHVVMNWTGLLKR
jgi:eukaryotic-like serine/threonine-protein kinase